MQAFRAAAGPGEVFVFEPELGPPPYAILDEGGAELWSRLDATDHLASMGRRAWERSAATVAPSVAAPGPV
jgi:hypothetical protein